MPRLLTPAERWILRGALAILLIAVVLSLGHFFANHLVATPRTGGAYREAVVGTPRLINPILAVSDVDRDLTRLIYSGLLKYNNQGELVGDLAETYNIEKDGLKIRFTLRDNLSWHDSEPLTSDDLIFTLEAIKNPAWRSPLWRSFQNITAEKIDERTITITAEAFISELPHLFTFGILPKHIWEQVDPKSASLAVWNLKPIGSGPFEFDSLAKTYDGTLNLYRLAHNNQYYNGAPYLNEIVLQFFPDFESAIQALREHTVDGVSFVPGRLQEKIPASGINLITAQFPHFTSLFFQSRKAPALRDKAVRQALGQALDRSAISALVPNAKPSATPFIENQIGYARTMSLPQANLEQAKQTLEKAEWKKDDKGWIKDGKRLILTLTTLDDPINLAVADATKKSWEQLGVEVKLEAAHRVAFEREVIRPRAYEVLLFSSIGSADPDPYAFWHSTQIDDPGLNLSDIAVRNIDLSLEQGRTTTIPAERFNAYFQFQQLLISEAPGIILYSSPYPYAVSKKVRGIAIETMAVPADRWNGVEKWFVRSRPGWK